jgi:hypothetical protein
VLDLQTQPVACHRCGHGYALHEPACTTGRCDCAGFRWVDPAPARDALGYHRAQEH